MFFRMLSADRMELLTRPLWRNSMIILCLVPMLAGLFAFLISEGIIGNGSSAGEITWPRALDTIALPPIFTATVFVGMLLTYVIPPLSIAKSYRERTIQNWIMRGIDRPQLIVAKLINLFIAALLIILTAVLMNGIVTLIITLIKGEPLNFTDVNWGYVVRNIVAIWYSFLPYIAFSCFIAIWSRSAVVSLLCGTLFFAFTPNLIVLYLNRFFDGIDEIAKFLPSSLESSLESWVTGDDALVLLEMVLAPGWAAVAIGLYILLFLSLSIVAFRRQNLGG